METRQIIYYNMGTKMLLRLCVSLNTLIKSGTKTPIKILADADSYDKCSTIAAHFGVEAYKSIFKSAPMRHQAFLNKCRLHQVSKADKTIFIDSDTIVVRPFDDVFDTLDEYEFATTKFSNWSSTQRNIKRRIEQWRPLLGDILDESYSKTPYALNTGFYAWRKGSKFMDDWYGIAMRGSEFFIPDEISCQIMLHKYDHTLLDNSYNTSCKHDRINGTAKVIHFHGRKHCRVDKGQFLYNSDLWYSEYEKIKNVEFIRFLADHDRQFRKYQDAYKSLRGSK